MPLRQAMNSLVISLDIPTITLSRALMQLILAGLVVYVGSRQERADVARLWALGLLLNGAALLLFLVVLPSPWHHLATAANHLGYAASGICFLVGFWRFAGTPSNRWLIALLIAIPITGLISWDLVWPSARMRILFSATAQTIFLFALQHSLKGHTRIEIDSIYRGLRILVIAYLLVFVWSYANAAQLLPTSALIEVTYHRSFFSLASLLFMLALAVGCLALQFALLATRETDRAMTDWLTGLLNRRGFFHALRENQERQSAASTSSSVIVIDVDHFKVINDRFGHNSGDRALKALAVMLQEQTSDGELVARSGGEEFCIFLPGAGIETATAMAESIREACERIDVAATGGEGIPFTISAGVCEVPAGSSFDDALIRADNALYVAKREGRNRVQVCAPAALLV